MRTRAISVRTVLLVAAMLAPSRLAAFPGSVRWGYGNCNTCHYNVAGGGLLNRYGRQLSKELLSTWGGDKEAQFAYGALSAPAWLALGGDVSLIATSRPPASGGNLDLLQADLEMAVTHGRLMAVATAGMDADPSGMKTAGWLSRRHYLQLELRPTLSVRAGRFMPNFGVWAGDPFAATRRSAGWDHETYNVEANWITPRFNLAATAMVGSASGPAQSGGSVSGGLFLAGRAKVWLSAARRHEAALDRTLLAASSVIGIGAHAYLLTETLLQRARAREPAAAGSWETFVNGCLARETVKGLYVLLVEEASHRPPADGAPPVTAHTFGTSLRWFPRSHVELQLRWRRRTADAVSPAQAAGVSFWVHYYP